MTTYTALLRGIMPSNPNMHSAKLKAAFETMAFKNVQTVISSGNVIFETAARQANALEDKIEKALPKLLKFESTTFVRSQAELTEMAKANPFGDLEKDSSLYLVVTFLKTESQLTLPLPYEGKGYTFLAKRDRAVLSYIDTRKVKVPDVMRVFEKSFGKEITTRTWKTLGRIVKKMEDGGR